MEEFEKQLEEVCAKDLHELTDSDKGFIRARAGYMSKENQEKFAEVLEGIDIEQVEKEEEEDTEEDEEVEDTITETGSDVDQA